MDITDALMTAAWFVDTEKPQRNADGDTMREAATEIHKLRQEREELRAKNGALQELLTKANGRILEMAELSHKHDKLILAACITELARTRP